MLERPKRQKLGRPLIEPQLGKELEEVDVLDDLERVLGGEGGGAIIAFGRIVDVVKLASIPFDLECDKLNTSCTVGRFLLAFGSSKSGVSS